MRRLKGLTALVFLLLMLSIGLGVTQTFAEPPTPQGEVDGDRLAVGDVVGSGVREGSACKFTGTKIFTSVPKGGKPRWLAIEIDGNCGARVNAKWEGSLKDGPHNVTDPLVQKLSVKSPGVLEKLTSSMASAAAPSALTSVKTSQQYVWMYGYGGTGDYLTQTDGAITWSYDGTWATLGAHPFNCQGHDLGAWKWQVDGCGETEVQFGPASQVWHTVRGNFHCDPSGQPPCSLGGGYAHYLWNEEDGRGNGSSACYFGWGGTIVAGVTRQIVQGCQ